MMLISSIDVHNSIRIVVKDSQLVSGINLHMYTYSMLYQLINSPLRDS